MIKKISILILALIVGLTAIGYVMVHPLFYFNPNDVPAITANPIDADRVFSISKFRSDAGHDYSFKAWDGETCRSMKHYFNWGQDSVNNMPVRSNPTPGHPDINIYAPFNGRITAVDPEQINLGKQVHIASDKNPSFYVRIFHVDLLPGLAVGSHVTSGEKIATIGPMDGIDVSYEAFTIFGKTVYLSIFQYMTPQAFAPYAKLGYKPSDFILSRSQADALGYQCGDNQQFIRPPGFYNGINPQTEGYVTIRPNPYQYLYNQNQGRGY